jgi:hypothetical protein
MSPTKAKQIEFLCNREYPDYEAVKPERIAARTAMTMPGEDNGVPLSRGRSIPPDEQKSILRDVAAFQRELELKPAEEIERICSETVLKDWRAQKLTLDEAANAIAAKIFPDDGYPWTIDQRAACDEHYRCWIKGLILCGGVPFVNPHTKQNFDHARLSKDHFPEDGLIRVEDLHRCMMKEHAKKGYFPPPPARLSKAPPPITPITHSGPSFASPNVPKFEAPNWPRWSKLDRAYLWEAACLVSGIEPPRPDGLDIWDLHGLTGFPPAFFAVWEAVNRDDFFSKAENVGTSGRMLHSVNLDGFAHWAIEKGFQVAPELRDIAARFSMNIDPKPDTVQPEAVQKSALQDLGQTKISSAKHEWVAKAKNLGTEYVEAWRAAGYTATVDDAALFVEGVFITEGTFNTRKEAIDRETIKREALVGITGRKPGQRISGKKIPEEKRHRLP